MKKKTHEKKQKQGVLRYLDEFPVKYKIPFNYYSIIQRIQCKSKNQLYEWWIEEKWEENRFVSERSSFSCHIK